MLELQGVQASHGAPWGSFNLAQAGHVGLELGEGGGSAGRGARSGGWRGRGWSSGRGRGGACRI